MVILPQASAQRSQAADAGSRFSSADQCALCGEARHPAAIWREPAPIIDRTPKTMTSASALDSRRRRLEIGHAAHENICQRRAACGRAAETGDAHRADAARVVALLDAHASGAPRDGRRPPSVRRPAGRGRPRDRADGAGQRRQRQPRRSGARARRGAALLAGRALAVHAGDDGRAVRDVRRHAVLGEHRPRRLRHRGTDLAGDHRKPCREPDARPPLPRRVRARPEGHPRHRTGRRAWPRPSPRCTAATGARARRHPSMGRRLRSVRQPLAAARSGPRRSPAHHVAGRASPEHSPHHRIARAARAHLRGSSRPPCSARLRRAATTRQRHRSRRRSRRSPPMRRSTPASQRASRSSPMAVRRSPTSGSATASTSPARPGTCAIAATGAGGGAVFKVW